MLDIFRSTIETIDDLQFIAVIIYTPVSRQVAFIIFLKPPETKSSVNFLFLQPDM